jgi:tetratricopeptide (TPR) repeat protein
MSVISCRSWPILAAAGTALLLLSACAPNRTVEPNIGPALAAAEREESRYGTLLRLAASTRAAGDPAAAVKLYQQAIQIEGGRVEAYVLLGDTLIELGAFQDAAATYDDALKRKDNAAAHRGYARAMLGLNRPEAAVVHFQAVLSANPNDVQAHNGLGVAFDLAGQPEAAEAAYRDGLEVAPDSILLRNNLGLSLALAGRYEESLKLLRAVVDEPGAKVRNRQNLALAYGLSGNLVAAEQIARLDLGEEDVQNNLAYYAALAAVDDQRKRAAALGVHPPDVKDRSSDAETSRRIGALALGGRDLELGLAPTGRWFVNLGDYTNAQQASAAWRQLRSQHGDVLGELSRLAGVQDGGQPLLVGPLADADSAQSVCGTLRGRGQNCRALAL